MSQIFRDIKILDFTTNVAGPYATAMFTDHGAEVIKIERPVFGDDTRHFYPQIGDESCFYWFLNRGKKSFAINLHDPANREIIYKIVQDVDIVCESFRPGVMKRLGFDYDTLKELKPDLIYCSISTYGQNGPYSEKAGYDVIAQAQSGFLEMTGEENGPCYRAGFMIGDYTAGLNAYGAILTALYHRNATGEGQFIDVALVDGMVSMNHCIDQHEFLNTKVSRTGNHSENLCPYGIYEGKNGQYAVIGAVGDGPWKRLCQAMKREDMISDPELADMEMRCHERDKIVKVIEDWLKSYDDIKDAIEILDDYKIPCSKVSTIEEVVNDQNLIDRGTIIRMPPTRSYVDKGYETFLTRGPWVKYSKTPSEFRQPADLGQHNEEIFARYEK